jgi:ferritin
MMKQNLLDGFNAQIVNELHAMSSYMAIACYMDAQDLKILSAFFFKQADEERQHALKLMNYLLEIGANVKIGAIPAPRADYKSVAEAVSTALEQEKVVSQQIDALMTLALNDHDHATSSFLRWFVDEQVEEVSSMTELLGLVERAGDVHILLVEDRLMKKGLSPRATPESE